MKSIGKIACALLLTLAATAAVAGDIVTEIEESSISVGESTTLRLKISGNTSDIKPVKYPAVPGLEIKFAGTQRSFQVVNGKSWFGVELLFSVTALKKGKYRIPPFIFERGDKRFSSSEVTLLVSSGSGGASVSNEVRPDMELSAKRAYVGEPVIMRYYYLTSGARASFRGFEEFPETKGFVINTVEGQQDDADSDEIRGDYIKNHISSYALIPAEAGSHMVGGGKGIITVEGGRGRFDSFPFAMFSESRPIFFDRARIEVLPLPEKGRPAGYRGDIGNFTIRADYSPEPVKVFDEKRIIVTVEGTGNLITMTRPGLDREIEGVKVLTEEGESSLSIQGNSLTGMKKFIITMIPEKGGAYKAGTIKLCFFDPSAGEYRTVETKEISFSATGESAASRTGFDDDGKKAIDFNPLYIIFIILAVSGGLVFIVLWERRRFRIVAGQSGEDTASAIEDKIVNQGDYLEDMKNALRDGDSGAFLTAAERALNLMSRQKNLLPEGDTHAALKTARDEIYSFKFGGKKISGDDMERLHRYIKGIGKKSTDRS